MHGSYSTGTALPVAAKLSAIPVEIVESSDFAKCRTRSLYQQYVTLSNTEAYLEVISLF